MRIRTALALVVLLLVTSSTSILAMPVRGDSPPIEFRIWPDDWERSLSIGMNDEGWWIDDGSGREVVELPAGKVRMVRSDRFGFEATVTSEGSPVTVIGEYDTAGALRSLSVRSVTGEVLADAWPVEMLGGDRHITLPIEPIVWLMAQFACGYLQVVVDCGEECVEACGDEAMLVMWRKIGCGTCSCFCRF